MGEMGGGGEGDKKKSKKKIYIRDVNPALWCEWCVGGEVIWGVFFVYFDNY